MSDAVYFVYVVRKIMVGGTWAFVKYMISLFHRLKNTACVWKNSDVYCCIHTMFPRFQSVSLEQGSMEVYYGRKASSMRLTSMMHSCHCKLTQKEGRNWIGLPIKGLLSIRAQHVTCLMYLGGCGAYKDKTDQHQPLAHSEQRQMHRKHT